MFARSWWKRKGKEAADAPAPALSLALQGGWQDTQGAGQDWLSGFENLSGSAWADHTWSTYWRMVRSDEKKPMPAVLRMAERHHAAGSRHLASTRACASPPATVI